MLEFSVLTSIYIRANAQHYSECLQSIADQETKPNEVVVVHDGPVSDDIIAVENEFEAILPLKIIKLTNNLGLGLALNAGIEHCSNEWIARMDADDICTPDRFTKQIAFINENPGIDFVGSSIAEFENENLNCITGYRNLPSSHPAIVSKSRFRNPMNHMTVMYRKSNLQKLGGYKSLILLEDYYLWIQALKHGYNFANIPEPLVFARVDQNWLRRRKGMRYLRNELILLSYMLKIKHITTMQFIINFITRSLLRLSPNVFLKTTYYILRSKES